MGDGAGDRWKPVRPEPGERPSTTSPAGSRPATWPPAWPSTDDENEALENAYDLVVTNPERAFKL